MKERKRHAPMVPPTIAPKLGFEELEEEAESDWDVGELTGSLVTVA